MVRFVHDSTSDRQKADLFDAARSGQIAVLVGSTQKMGVGTNVQARAIALHHLDAPWRPADMEQRDGRILRQGNLNPEVTIIRYVTEGSFDTFMYQTLERKSRFIHQVAQGGTDIARTVEDVSETTLSLAEVKALSTGNPLILEKAGIDNDVARLERLASAHRAEQRRAGRVIATGQEQLPALEVRVEALHAALGRRADISGDNFTATIDGHHYTKRIEAAAQLIAALHQARHRADQTIPLGQIGGIDLEVKVDGIGGHTQLSVRPAGLYSRSIVLEPVDLKGDPLGLLTRVTNLVTGLETGLDQLAEQANRLRADIATSQQILQQPFDHAQELAHLKARQADIDDKLSKADKADEAAPKIAYPPVDATPEDWADFLALHDPTAHPAALPTRRDTPAWPDRPTSGITGRPAGTAEPTAAYGPDQPAPAQEPTGPDHMTTAQLGQHVSQLRASLTGKRQSLQELTAASKRLADRMSEQTEPDPLLNASLQRHHNDRTRLETEVAHIANALNTAQRELEQRPHPTQPDTKPARTPPRQASSAAASRPHQPGRVAPTPSGPVPGL
jgi:hypothetical protein